MAQVFRPARVVANDRMAHLLTDVVNTPVHEIQARVPDDVRVEVEIARERDARVAADRRDAAALRTIIAGRLQVAAATG